MSLPRVVAVAPASAAERAGLRPGDEVMTINGHRPRDVIAWQLLADDADLSLDVERDGVPVALQVPKASGEALGVEVQSAVFDQVRTCDNHCEFCFIYQLPPGLRPSLYVKDDDYRLSFLYGNFTTLTRFTELDLERVVTERLGPLYVSIHSTDPELRSRMLSNRRGATSLRWLRALLDHGVEVHGQVVVCPGVNDDDALETTLAGVLDQYPELATVCVVPLGVSRYSHQPAMRSHSPEEAAAVLDLVEDWQGVFRRVLGRSLVFASDEYYLLASRPLPPAADYEGFPQHENGVGIARAFLDELAGAEHLGETAARAGGFFAWVDGAPAEGYRAPRGTGLDGQRSDRRPACVITSAYGAAVLEPAVAALGVPGARVLAVENRFFGGNIAVAGLLVGSDIAAVLRTQPAGHRYLLPDVCLSRGVFLDGTAPEALPRPVEVVPADGRSLRAALDGA